MKTAKEKAIELFQKFDCISMIITHDDAKDAALMACDLLMEQAMEIHSEFPELTPDNEIRFLENVKREIEAL